MNDLLMLMAHKQCYVTLMLNKCYTSGIAVFDMFRVILPTAFNFFKTCTTPLIEDTVNE